MLASRGRCFGSTDAPTGGDFRQRDNLRADLCPLLRLKSGLGYESGLHVRIRPDKHPENAGCPGSDVDQADGSCFRSLMLMPPLFAKSPSRICSLASLIPLTTGSNTCFSQSS